MCCMVLEAADIWVVTRQLCVTWLHGPITSRVRFCILMFKMPASWAGQLVSPSSSLVSADLMINTSKTYLHQVCNELAASVAASPLHSAAANGHKQRDVAALQPIRASPDSCCSSLQQARH